jgi:hypothetical protein
MTPVPTPAPAGEQHAELSMGVPASTNPAKAALGRREVVQQPARSRLGRMLWYLIPSLASTLLLRWYLDTSSVTRDWPLNVAETLVVFAAALAVVAVLRWLGHLLKLR